MSLFKKIFGSDKNQEQEISKYNRIPELPTEEEFILNFQKNGGKFIYCENKSEVQEQFLNILQENDWFESRVSCYEPHLYPLLIENKLIHENSKLASFHLCSCEGLLAEDGSIMFSSNQLKQFNTFEINQNIVVFCGISKIIKNRREGLKIIQNIYEKNLPTNITTIKSFTYKNDVEEDSFMNYGVSQKNLYLLVVED